MPGNKSSSLREFTYTVPESISDTHLPGGMDADATHVSDADRDTAIDATDMNTVMTNTAPDTMDVQDDGINLATDNPDDNAGDADASGDGSACVDDLFMEYNEDEGHNAVDAVDATKDKILEKNEFMEKFPVEDFVCLFF